MGTTVLSLMQAGSPSAASTVRTLDAIKMTGPEASPNLITRVALSATVQQAVPQSAAAPQTAEPARDVRVLCESEQNSNDVDGEDSNDGHPMGFPVGIGSRAEYEAAQQKEQEREAYMRQHGAALEKAAESARQRYLYLLEHPTPSQGPQTHRSSLTQIQLPAAAGKAGSDHTGGSPSHHAGQGANTGRAIDSARSITGGQGLDMTPARTPTASPPAAAEAPRHDLNADVIVLNSRVPIQPAALPVNMGAPLPVAAAAAFQPALNANGMVLNPGVPMQPAAPAPLPAMPAASENGGCCDGCKCTIL